MTELVASADSSTSRCLGRRVARELTEQEIASVSGGASYTGIQNFHWNDDGTADFEYGDYTW